MSSKDYQFWLTANGSKSKIELPVNPEEITIKRGSNNDSVRILGIGEVTIMQDPSADKISFSSFFPSSYFPGCKNAKPKSPSSYVKAIKKMKEGSKPILFTVTNMGINGYYTIEDFDVKENGGDVGTIHYSITLKQYREVTTRTVKVSISNTKASIKTTATRVTNTTSPKTYTVVKGDCLWKIAKKFYGNGAQYTKIYNANKDKIKNPNLIYVGQVLVIP